MIFPTYRTSDPQAGAYERLRQEAARDRRALRNWDIISHSIKGDDQVIARAIFRNWPVQRLATQLKCNAALIDRRAMKLALEAMRLIDLQQKHRERGLNTLERWEFITLGKKLGFI